MEASPFVVIHLMSITSLEIFISKSGIARGRFIYLHALGKMEISVWGRAQFPSSKLPICLLIFEKGFMEIVISSVAKKVLLEIWYLLGKKICFHKN